MAKIEMSRDGKDYDSLTIQLATALGETLRGEVRAFESVTSTMDVAHALAQEGVAEGTLVWAQRQEQGRGRLGRVWESPAGGVYCSLIVRPQRPAEEIPQLSLVAGLSAAEAIRECANLSPRVRWPNDLLLDGKKVAGILLEGSNGERGTGNAQRYIVVGVGVNVTTDPQELPETATSLAEAHPQNPKLVPPDPYLLTARLYRRFFRWYDVWAQQGFLPVRQALRPHMGLFGEVVRINQQQATSDKRQENSVEGQALDIDEAGRLLVRLDSGVVKAFEAGEVTLLQ